MKYGAYGTLPATWYFDAASKSASLRGPGGATRWYVRTWSHHVVL